jgi:HK97 family phage prohead protease
MDIRFCTAIKKGIDAKERRVTAWASVECIDRDNEVILASAWQHADSTSEFEKNPVGLVGHDYKSLPVFKVERLEKTGQGLKFTARFFETQAGREAFGFIRESGLASFSVAFIPVSWRDVRTSDLARMGIDTALAKGDRVRVYDHVKLIEISLVAIPANTLATALGAAFAEGRVKSLELRKALDTVIHISDKPRRTPSAQAPGSKKMTDAELLAYLKGDFRKDLRLIIDKTLGRVR